MLTRDRTVSPATTAAVAGWYVPAMVTLAALVVFFASARNDLAVVLVIVGAVALSFAAERLAPYETDWNRGHGDRRRDTIHAAVNETLNALSVAALPLLASSVTVLDAWPRHWPFLFQVALAVIVFDAGVTLAHRASHRVGWLWAFHAVHHSVTRYYGFNGLMKHPVHQAIEMTAGVVPLVLLGLPQSVAVALAALTIVQLLLQHSNVDYRVGRLAGWWALNQGHRLHHLHRPGEGDVNFGLFTLVWDRALRTYALHDRRGHLTTDDIGVAGRPDYPTDYLAQLAQPVLDIRTAHR